MRFGLSSVCPRSFGSPFIGPHRRFFPLFFHVFLSSCLFILILSFSCAHYRPDLSLYTYTHAYSTYSEVQVAQVRYNEVWLIGCPFSLGSFSSATIHTFVCLVLLVFICPFCVHMCLPPSRAGWRSHTPPLGEACVCNPWSHRDPSGLVFILHYGRGAMNTLEGIAQRRPFHRVVIFLRDASGTYLLFPFPFLNGERLSQEPHDTVLFQSFGSLSADAFDSLAAFDLTLLASLPLPDPQAPRVLTGTLRNWNPRPACGTAFSSVHNISSVCVCVSTPVPKGFGFLHTAK